VRKEQDTHTPVDNLAKYSAIFTILSLLDSAQNLLQNHNYISHHNYIISDLKTEQLLDAFVVTRFELTKNSD